MSNYPDSWDGLYKYFLLAHKIIHTFRTQYYNFKPEFYIDQNSALVK